MNFRTIIIVMAVVTRTDYAAAVCEPIRIGYVNQERPPYYLGAGSDIPAKPGASAELFQRFAASAGCDASLRRLPVNRIIPSLAAGLLDFAPLDSSSKDIADLAFPRDKNNQLDYGRAVPINIVVFVRSADHIPPATEPAKYFRDRLLGVTLGATYRARIQGLGMKIDSGAVDIARNLEKLKLSRIDGFAVSVTSPGDMDAYVAQKYKGAIIRLPQPLFTDHIWIAASASYYAAHPGQVEKMWTWLGSAGKREYFNLLKEYGDMPLPTQQVGVRSAISTRAEPLTDD
ncbi:hypothetical protein [Duganella sp.]|uniref:hypothetical protein n=1 Tax=Duganella sp. TaxID=1904440 RepID=UPI0031D8AC0C